MRLKNIFMIDLDFKLEKVVISGWKRLDWLEKDHYHFKLDFCNIRRIITVTNLCKHNKFSSTDSIFLGRTMERNSFTLEVVVEIFLEIKEQLNSHVIKH